VGFAGCVCVAFGLAAAPLVGDAAGFEAAVPAVTGLPLAEPGTGAEGLAFTAGLGTAAAPGVLAAGAPAPVDDGVCGAPPVAEFGVAPAGLSGTEGNR